MTTISIGVSLVQDSPIHVEIDPLDVPVGSGQTDIVWNLEESPSGAAIQAIFFHPAGPSWTGTQPQRVSDIQWTAVDVNENSGEVDIQFSYQVAVTFNGHTFLSPDPEIKNQPGGGPS